MHVAVDQAGHHDPAAEIDAGDRRRGVDRRRDGGEAPVADVEKLAGHAGACGRVEEQEVVEDIFGHGDQPGSGISFL